MDPSLVMGGAAPPPPTQPPYSYPMPIPQPVSVGENDSHQYGGGPPGSVNPASTYIPVAPPIGAFPMHPYAAMFGNRHGEGGNTYMPFPTFPPQALTSSHSHIERPYAQYPTSVQPPLPGGYVVQIPANLASQTAASALGAAAAIPVVAHSNQDSRSKSKHSNNKDLPQSVSSQHTSLEQGRDNTVVMALPVRVSDFHITGVRSGFSIILLLAMILQHFRVQSCSLWNSKSIENRLIFHI